MHPFALFVAMGLLAIFSFLFGLLQRSTWVLAEPTPADVIRGSNALEMRFRREATAALAVGDSAAYQLAMARANLHCTIMTLAAIYPDRVEDLLLRPVSRASSADRSTVRAVAPLNVGDEPRAEGQEC